jgi:hypothetical protein
MPQKLDRRRYADVVRFLRETVNNPNISHRTRFAAAERLIDLYATHDRKAEREQGREHGRSRKTKGNTTHESLQQQDGPATREESALEAPDTMAKNAFDTVLEEAGDAYAARK